MAFYISMLNFNKVGQVITEILIFERSPIDKDTDF